MSRYPTRQGLAIPVTELGYEIVSHDRGRTNHHHMWFDRASYMAHRYRQIFRGLPIHVVTMRIGDHAELHERYSPPAMPKDSMMIEVVDEYLFLHGVIDVVREHKTNETYQISPAQWAGIRSGHATSMDRPASLEFTQLNIGRTL